jgi:ubiquinone/menaquinone biosynthesis C-methylase UbiE
MNFSQPLSHILQMGLAEDAVVADFGAGSGHHTFALKHAVAQGGRVYAVDIQEQVLQRLWREARKNLHHDVETVWADIAELPFQSNFLDAGVLSNTLFQIEDKEQALTEIKRVLKPGGSLLVVDWSDSFGHIGPHTEAVCKKSFLETLMEKVGFHKKKECVTGPHHYAILYTKEI